MVLGLMTVHEGDAVGCQPGGLLRGGDSIFVSASTRNNARACAVAEVVELRDLARGQV